MSPCLDEQVGDDEGVGIFEVLHERGGQGVEFVSLDELVVDEAVAQVCDEFNGEHPSCMTDRIDIGDGVALHINQSMVAQQTGDASADVEVLAVTVGVGVKDLREVIPGVEGGDRGCVGAR